MHVKYETQVGAGAPGQGPTLMQAGNVWAALNVGSGLYASKILINN